MFEVRLLTFAYQKAAVLRDVEFSVSRGEMACLLGANGSGKTTVIKCLNGILQPARGEIVLDGMRLDSMKQREIARYISMVPQEHSMAFAYQVIDVVVMGITPYLDFGRMPADEDYQRALSILQMLGIEELAARNYNRCSGGERQLALIARSLMQDTSYLVMDEPTSHLDFKNQYLLMMELKKLSKQGRGIITALHDPNLALKFCDKVIILKDGQVLASGKTSQVMNSENLQQAYGIDILINEVKNSVEVSIPEVAG
ncbi:MAG: ABC transporter ATP-binding protein [Halanaerobium sp.]|nr:ABC transporter ATP-binding protein [Halanaerobium sp.]